MKLQRKQNSQAVAQHRIGTRQYRLFVKEVAGGNRTVQNATRRQIKKVINALTLGPTVFHGRIQRELHEFLYWV